MKHYFYNVKKGDVFGKFTVLDIKNEIKGVQSPRHVIMLLCRCRYCGSEKWYEQYSITHNKRQSCGCLKHIKYGLHNSRLWNIWRGIKRRCNMPSCSTYKNYGGRGIMICREWQDDFSNFEQWATAHGYNDNLSIDRIDVNGNYCPENCRWVTSKVQNNNRRNNHFIEYNGETKTTAQWEEFFSLPKGTITRRLRNGMTFEQTITLPVKRYKKSK